MITQRGLSISCLSLSRRWNKVPETAQLLSSGNLSLTVLEAWSWRARCQHGQILVRDLFQGADCKRFAVSSHGGRDKGALRGLSHFLFK